MMMQGVDYTLKLKVCLVGDGAVGKTSLVRKYVFDEFSDDYLATIGTKITKREMTVRDPDEDMEIKVDMAIWDIMGQHGFRRLLQEAYFFGVDGVIAVCDLTRKETVDGLNDWLERIEEVAGDVPVITLGNKADLQEGLVVKEEDVERLAKTKNSEYLMTSAKTGENVERAFIDLTNTILKWRNAKKNERAAALQSQIGAEQPS
jgi:small GTP-binding protein